MKTHKAYALHILFSASILAMSISAHAADTLLPGDAAAGKKLVQAHCTSCHGSEVYTRNDRRIKSIEGLMAQVNGCNRQTKAGFTEDQINDVVNYLNEEYYKF